LLVGTVEVPATAFVFYQDNTFPKQVDKACAFSPLSIWIKVGGEVYLLFKSSNPAAANAEYIEEAVPKRFRFGVFT
jgi:hypothetical protein